MLRVLQEHHSKPLLCFDWYVRDNIYLYSMTLLRLRLCDIAVSSLRMITPSFEGHKEDVLMSLLSEYGIRSTTTCNISKP